MRRKNVFISSWQEKQRQNNLKQESDHEEGRFSRWLPNLKLQNLIPAR